MQYERKTDFRRLTETLHNHVGNLIKYQHQSQGVNINSPETLQAHIETRLKALNVAMSLELWQVRAHSMFAVRVASKQASKD